MRPSALPARVLGVVGGGRERGCETCGRQETASARWVCDQVGGEMLVRQLVGLRPPRSTAFWTAWWRSGGGDGNLVPGGDGNLGQVLVAKCWWRREPGHARHGTRTSSRRRGVDAPAGVRRPHNIACCFAPIQQRMSPPSPATTLCAVETPLSLPRTPPTPPQTPPRAGSALGRMGFLRQVTVLTSRPRAP